MEEVAVEATAAAEEVPLEEIPLEETPAEEAGVAEEVAEEEALVPFSGSFSDDACILTVHAYSTVLRDLEDAAREALQGDLNTLAERRSASAEIQMEADATDVIILRTEEGSLDGAHEEIILALQQHGLIATEAEE